jgi:DNA-binding transcriptional LysR family regulator
MAKFEGLQLVWLESFVQVAESGKRTAAAKEMKIHQGTVTKHIQKLEQWLGGRMLLDSSFPPRIYPDGEKFLPVAMQILKLLDEARRPLPVHVEAPPAPRGSAKNLRPPSYDRTPKDG